MFQQRFRQRNTPSVYSTRRSWLVNAPPVSKPPYSPALFQPGVLVHVSNGEVMPPPTSHLFANWRFKNFYGRITECTETTARVTKANGLSVVLHSAINNIRLATKEEVARVQQEYPHL